MGNIEKKETKILTEILSLIELKRLAFKNNSEPISDINALDTHFT